MKRTNARILFLSSLASMLAICGMLAGCGANLAELASTIQDIEAKHGDPAEHLTNFAANAAVDPTIAAIDAPSPSEAPKTALQAHEPPHAQRTNPFEFAIDVADQSPVVTDESSLELKLFGFAGDNDPKAIIHIGESTRLMSRGDRWGDIEILEVAPPEVRIRTNGVVRTWSLLGHQATSSH